MNAKQNFLEQLRTNLRKYPSGAVDDYIDYYAELISERIANGEKETAVLEDIGTPKEVAANFKQDNAIEQAVKKPTASNGVRALIAVLSVLSLPLLIPLAAVFIALLITAAALFVTGLAVLVVGILSSILSVFDMASIVAAGDAPLYLLFLAVGIALIVGFLAFELSRGLLFISRWLIRTLIGKLNAYRNKRKEQ